MNALEMLRTWPGMGQADAATICASPAWCYPARYAGEPAWLTRADGEEPADGWLTLDIAWDGENARLAIAAGELFPDLRLLWNVREKMPPEVLLALAEKECGELFATVERIARRQLSVRALAADPARPSTVYRLRAAAGDCVFAVDFPGEAVMDFGRLEHLDVGHPAVRGLRRKAYPDYAAFSLTAAERAALRPGDWLLLPENAAAGWRTEPPFAEETHLVSAVAAELEFGRFADGDLPPPPEPAELVVVAGDRVLFAAEPGRVGMARAVRLTDCEPERKVF